ncbi:hypothetical protein Pfo_020482 [Paulownia fortunei]|nr:hypothetical protein Pfo_020482 [Paulownia fortunei]
MNQVSDRGACFPEDINKIEDQKKSCGSIESRDTSHGIHVSCGRPSSSEISTQSIVKLYVNSVQEGAEPINCNVNISLMKKNDDIAGINEVLEEDKSIKTYQKKKRLKRTELSDLQTTDLEIIVEEAGSSSPGLPHRTGGTSLDQPVDFASLTPCCFKSMNEKRIIAEDGVSMEVGENKLLEEALDCCLGFHKTSSNNDDKVLIGKSNGNTSENRDADMLALGLPEHRTENDIVLNVVSTETDNDEISSVASGDACCRDFPLHLDIKELCSPLSNDATKTNKNSCDADMLAVNLLEQLHDEAKGTVSNIEVHNVEFVEENIGNFPRVSSGDALGGDTLLHHEEQSVASDADLSLKQLEGSKGIASQVVKESINVAVNRAFAGYTGKKLLVLDVNGLLVDISSYVPYDYDPDDIILKKAVFKRPYCDDFLKFCFERFNVGVWSSRTKRNMEPILDFLLGNDKCKLLFCWDQSHCTDTGFTTVEKRHKPLLLKKLKRLWDKCEPDLPWERGVYNESNTLLLDDTPYKALSNPRYNAIFPRTYQFTDVRDNSLGPRGDLHVYLEGLAMAENVQEYVKQNPFGQRPITEKNLSWGFYLKVIEASSTPPRQTDEVDS